MKNKENESDKSFEEKLWKIAGFSLLFIIVTSAVYVLHIIINQHTASDFGVFGDYFGGVLSPILAFMALVALLLSIHYQVKEFKKSTTQLEESSNALNRQNSLMMDQIQEAKNQYLEEIEFKKIDAINKIIIQAIDCWNVLDAIKKNFNNINASNQTELMRKIGIIMISTKYIEPNFSNIYFLAKISKNYPADSPANIIFISTVFANFNSVMELWKQRNDEMKIISSIFTEKSRKDPYFSIETNSQYEEVIGIAKTDQIAKLTDACIADTYRSIHGLKKIILELPDIAETEISNAALENHGKILRYGIQQEFFSNNETSESS